MRDESQVVLIRMCKASSRRWILDSSREAFRIAYLQHNTIFINGFLL